MLVAAAIIFAQTPREVPLQSLDLKTIEQGWGVPHAGRSVDNHPLSIAGTEYKSGVGTHAVSTFKIRLNSAFKFTALAGMDDEVKGGSSVFEVWLDGKKAWTSGLMKQGMAAKPVEVNLNGAKEMTLVVTDGGDGIDYDHADWAHAFITTVSSGPVAMKAPPPHVEPPIPIAYGDPRGVTIHGPRIVGTTPGRPFLFIVPATGVSRTMSKLGEGPFRVSKGKLPAGLSLNEGNGIISGTVKDSGTYKFTIEARGRTGKDAREYTIVSGDHRLALTPPMGWNSWNIWATSVTAQKVKDSADAFVKAGLADYGYQYVNIDDAWEGGRDTNGFIETNKKFGDMKSLADYVHSKGLKLGIYSGPGPRTCANYEASYQHELKDAQQYAKWGIDYLKYDWCSYEEIAKGDHSLPSLQKPYIVMRQALDQVDRDIVYSMCQYGMGDVYKWGKSVSGGNLWRTTGDITDTWKSMTDIAFAHNIRSPYAQVGGWNDPDMLVVGQLGWGPNPRPTRLTPNEQITHITMWSMLAAPLIIGCDLTKLDKFTKAILCNHDVIEVDQDPLGRAATQRQVIGFNEVWARPLWDGTFAVALYNRGPERDVIKYDLSKLGLSGAQRVRDLWLMKNVPQKASTLTATVPAHGAMLFKVGNPRK